jgi:hypothetical protein
MVDPFAFGATRGGLGRAGELAGRAVLFVPMAEGVWHLLDVATGSDKPEDNESSWKATDAARSTINGWEIDWVPADETREFADKYFRGLDPSVVWGAQG